MSGIKELEKAEISSGRTRIPKVQEKTRIALETYNARLADTSAKAFKDGDESTVHAVIDALQSEIKNISDTMNEVDAMLVTMYRVIAEDIFRREQQIADEI